MSDGLFPWVLPKRDVGRTTSDMDSEGHFGMISSIDRSTTLSGRNVRKGSLNPEAPNTDALLVDVIAPRKAVFSKRYHGAATLKASDAKMSNTNGRSHFGIY